MSSNGRLSPISPGRPTCGLGDDLDLSGQTKLRESLRLPSDSRSCNESLTDRRKSDSSHPESKSALSLKYSDRL